VYITDEAHLGGGERRDAEVHVHLAAGDREVFDAPNEAPHPQTGGETTDDVNDNDNPVDRRERHEG
jgi:hypothetical protein